MIPIAKDRSLLEGMLIAQSKLLPVLWWRSPTRRWYHCHVLSKFEHSQLPQRDSTVSKRCMGVQGGYHNFTNTSTIEITQHTTCTGARFRIKQALEYPCRTNTQLRRNNITLRIMWELLHSKYYYYQWYQSCLYNQITRCILLQVKLLLLTTFHE